METYLKKYTSAFLASIVSMLIQSDTISGDILTSQSLASAPDNDLKGGGGVSTCNELLFKISKQRRFVKGKIRGNDMYVKITNP